MVQGRPLGFHDSARLNQPALQAGMAVVLHNTYEHEPRPLSGYPTAKLIGGFWNQSSLRQRGWRKEVRNTATVVERHALTPRIQESWFDPCHVGGEGWRALLRWSLW